MGKIQALSSNWTKSVLSSLPGRRKRRESVGKTSGKILAICQENPSVTIPELALMLGITERSVQRNMQKLQMLGLLRRVGGRKEGSWEVTHEGA
jgi:ATP-dependent DNA helicase RecG